MEEWTRGSLRKDRPIYFYFPSIAGPIRRSEVSWRRYQDAGSSRYIDGAESEQGKALEIFLPFSGKAVLAVFAKVPANGLIFNAPRETTITAALSRAFEK